MLFHEMLLEPALLDAVVVAARDHALSLFILVFLPDVALQSDGVQAVKVAPWAHQLLLEMGRVQMDNHVVSLRALVVAVATPVPPPLVPFVDTGVLEYVIVFGEGAGGAEKAERGR